MSTTGADLLVASLLANDINVVFTLPGLQLDPVFDALAKRRDDFKIYHTRHEQAAAYMADGYARVTGKPACCLVVPGPGVLNAMSGLATAYACSSPILCVAGQTPTGTIDRELGLLHEIKNQLETIRAVVTWAGRAETVNEIPGLMAHAVAEMMNGRTRPVALEIAPDILASVCDPGVDIPVAHRHSSDPDAESISRAVDLLRHADRPLIVAGGGVTRSMASIEITTLAERLGAPVVMTTNGKGSITARNRLAYEAPALRHLLPEADVVLAVGTRFSRRNGQRWEINGSQKLIKIDVDGSEVSRGIAPDIPIQGDAKAVLDIVIDLMPASTATRGGWRDLGAIKSRVVAEAQAIQPQATFGGVIREALPDDAIVIDGMNQVGYWSRIGFPVYEPRTFISPGYQGTLGFELPTGLGAQVGAPERRVVVIAGDGGLMFNIGELATAAQHHINVVTVVFNDNAFGNVLRTQDVEYGGRRIASELHNPNFVQLAESFGIIGLRAEGAEELGRCLRFALGVDRPSLIEVPVGMMTDPWPLIQAH